MNATNSKWVDYLRLCRIPNVFTAVADVTMGYLFVHQALRPPLVYGALVAASVLLYSAGMVLNDVFDVEQDRRERPDRPVASGRIPPAHARRFGWGLLASGVLCGLMAGALPQVAAAPAWRSGLVAVLLAVCILLYDAALKRTPLGPLVMGSCRLLNVLLGMAVAAPQASTASGLLGFAPAQLLTAAGIGVYVAGVTWFARTEARTSRRWSLAAATVTMMTGIALLGLIYSWMPPEQPKTLAQDSTWFLLLGLLAFTIVRRCSMAVAEPSPQRVQLAVKNAIWSLIVLDAAVVLLVASPGWALLVLALLLPTVAIGQWIEAT